MTARNAHDRVLDIVPWSEDLPAAVAAMLLEEAPGERDLSRFMVIFPHRRPGRYLREALLHAPQLPKPCRLPEMLTMGGLLARFAGELAQDDADAPGPAAVSIGPLDRVAVLSDVVAGLAAAARPEDPLANLATLPPERFYPWGVRLAQLMEDFFRHDIDPTDIPYASEETGPLAAALLESLGRIGAAYSAALRAEGLTTPGLEARRVIHALEPCVTRYAFRRLLFAGVVDTAYGDSGPLDTSAIATGAPAPSAADAAHRLCRAFWENGARVIIQSDPRIGTAETPHWACDPAVTLVRRWRPASLRLWTPPHPRDEGPATLELVEGYDVHSQLAALQTRLADNDRAAPAGSPQGAAIALLHESMLMPVLHALPQPEVNVSMGFPLARSSLTRLLETAMQLQEHAAWDQDAPANSSQPASAAAEAPLHWRDALELIRHPYLKMLDPFAPTAGEEAVASETPPGDDSTPDRGVFADMRPVMHELERRIRQGERHTAPAEWPDAQTLLAPPADSAQEAPRRLANAPSGYTEAAQALLEAVIERFIVAWSRIRTLGDLAATLEACCDLLIHHGRALWRRFPLDAEHLHRLLYSVIPQLRDCRMAAAPFDQALLFTVLRQMLASERAPFEAEPLSGLQVLGFLETRCVRFDEVHVLDAVESALPGAPAQDPLFPDALRRLVGLPDARRREAETAFHFHRLLKGSRRAVCLYQAGVGRSQDAKPVRSRYLEELLWRKERAAGRLFEDAYGDRGPLSVVHFPATPMPNAPEALARTPAMDEAVERLLQQHLSPTLLDGYLRCPLQFYYKYVVKLSEVDIVDEEGDPMAVGSLAHAVLEAHFRDHLHHTISAEAVDAEALALRYVDALHESDLYRQLSVDRQILLERAGKRRMRDYANALAEGRVLALERRLSHVIQTPDGPLHLTGKLDRLDARPAPTAEDPDAAELVVLDYKTGGAHTPAQNLWMDEAFWARVAAWPGLPAADFIEDAPRGETIQPPPDVFEEMAKRVKSVQLPAYVLLALAGETPWADAPPERVNAALVGLRKEGVEKRLFGPSLRPETRRTAVEEHFPTLFGFMLRHMRQSRAFTPRPDRHCAYCPFYGLCRRGPLRTAPDDAINPSTP